MALLASGIGAVLRELTRVLVFMAALTDFGRGLERHIAHVGLEIRRLVTIDAGHSLMRSYQWVVGLIMIEFRYVFPLVHGVAGFTSGGRTSGLSFCHLRLELAVMNVFMTSRTSEITEMKGRGGFGAAGLGGVAIRAGHRDVGASQNEFGLLVACERECRRRESLDGVTGFAAVQERRRSKLAGMFVLVTIPTGGKLDPVLGGGARWDVTFRAVYSRVRAFQRVGAGVVVFHGVQRRLPSIDVMTGLALTAVAALCELPGMCIFVAV